MCVHVVVVFVGKELHHQSHCIACNVLHSATAQSTHLEGYDWQYAEMGSKYTELSRPRNFALEPKWLRKVEFALLLLKEHCQHVHSFVPLPTVAALHVA